MVVVLQHVVLAVCQRHTPRADVAGRELLDEQCSCREGVNSAARLGQVPARLQEAA